jgi:hypothetical protein
MPLEIDSDHSFATDQLSLRFRAESTSLRKT